MNIPIIELLAQICLHNESNSQPPRALKREVKQGLRKMFESYFKDKIAYTIEYLFVTSKMVGIIKEEGDYLVALLKRDDK